MILARDPNTPDMFTDPAAKKPLANWAPAPVRAAPPPKRPPGWDMRSKVSRAISAAMRDSELNRDEIAKRMTVFLDEDVTLNVLNQYASEASEHSIPAHRLAALAHALDRADLLNLLTHPLGCEVVEQRWLPAIEDAQLAVDIEEKKKRQAQVRSLWRGRG